MATPLPLDDAFQTVKHLRPEIVHLFNQREPLAMAVIEALGKVMRSRGEDAEAVGNFCQIVTDYSLRNLIITERAELERLYGVSECMGDRKIQVPVGVKLNA